MTNIYRLSLPSKEKLHNLFIYKDGCLIWKRWNKIAGYKRFDSRIVIRIDNQSYMQSRIIWKMFFGSEPKEIDHINRNPFDDRIENMRSVTRSQNMYNTNLRSTNKSGIKGVHFDKERNKWFAVICNNYKTIPLGRYDNIEDAIKARKEAEFKYIDL